MLGFHHREFSAQLANSRRDFLAELGPDFRQWMGASSHSAATVKRAAHGYEATREAAMAAFAKSWRKT
jgi:hypothetical protein